MKVLFAIKRLTEAVGGAERVLCAVCSELVSRGHEVSILTFDEFGGKAFYSIDPRVRKIDLGIGNSSVSAGFIETLVRIRALRRFAYSERPDLAVGFMHSMYVPLAFALAGTGIPVIGSEHIVREHYRTRRFQYLLLIISAPLLNKLTVLSETIRMRYPSSIKRRMVVVPNPIETTEICAKFEDGKDSFILLSVGRLEPQKDHATLIGAFAQIASVFPRWRLKIVGEGSLRPYLTSLIHAHGLQDRIVMPGVIREIDNEYLAADCFVLPSQYEAFGLVTAEAMCFGLPVVGFADCPGTNELIENDRTGILIQPGADRAVSLGFALSRLMSDADLRRRLGSAGRDEIKKKLSLAGVCTRWEGLLNSVVRENKICAV